MIKIIGVGDIMPGGILNGCKKDFISKDVQEILCSADLKIGTLETAVGNEPNFYDEKMKRLADVIYVEDQDIERIKQLRFDVLSLANNHFFDLGPEGAKHAIDLLDKIGIAHVGAGRNIEEAAKPVIKVINRKSFAILGFCDWRDETVGWCPIASETTPGVNPMYDDYAAKEIKKYKKLYDYIVVVNHWGKEYDYYPTSHVFHTTKIMIDAGADLILGGHTHCVQPIMKYKGKSVIFSMGNFLFPDRLIVKPRSTFYANTLIDVTKLPVTDGYPKVEELTYKIWKPIARIGMITETYFDENLINTGVKYIKLSDDNYIDLTNLPITTEKKLHFIEKQLNSGVYEQIRIIVNFSIFIWHLPKRVLRKISRILCGSK